MEFVEWKEKMIKKPSPQYTHFDRRKSLNSCINYITNSEKIIHHSFYPFIHYVIRNRKVKNGKKCEPKERQIYYASHMDGWIYRYYSFLLNEYYNKRVKEDNIDSVSVAYRTELGKCNIDFAGEAFRNIKENSPCYIMIGDFTNFFDNLNHTYLKSMICDLLSVDKLPNDLYAVFKNVTRFSFVELTDLLTMNGYDDNPTDRKRFNDKTNERALPIDQFRKSKNIIHKNPNNDRGVPQGSPISSVLANIYMLSADKRIYEYVTSYGGFYMRYSDDFIIIMPKREIDFHCHCKYIKNILGSIPNLILSESKTNIFLYENFSIQDLKSKDKSRVNFLGFSFDGKYVYLRDKTISKYYNRMYRKARNIVKNNGFTKKHNRISCKNLYENYSYKGSLHYKKKMVIKTGKVIDKQKERGNFIDYIERAKREFPTEKIDNSTKNHMQKIRKILKSITK